MIEVDSGYFKRRLLEEHERAAMATSKEAEAAHRTLALLYLQRLSQPTERRIRQLGKA
jgi:hypothetical protein